MTSPSRAGAGLVLLLAGALGLAACQGGAGGAGPGAAPQPTTTTTAAPGGSSTTARPSPDALRNTATFAEPAGTRPDFIFPVTPKGYGSTANTRQLSSLMWRPLVWSGTGEQVGVNDRKSLFQSIAYSSDGKTVTIVLKDWSWSDGQPVSSRDVTFFLDLVKANETQWSRYSPGQLPDDIVSWRAAGQRTVVLTLDQAYSRFWFTDDELALVTPLPQHAWDRESARGPVGSFDQTAAGARKVWRFLVGEARDTATFATNPLWRVVDGPWQLRSFSSAGKAVFEPNPAYSGPDAPSLSRFVELPFATSAAELAALESGRVDVGYLPTSHLGEEQVVGLEDYRLTPWVGFSVSFVVPDLANPAVGPLLQQLYVRQALQHLVDQQAIVADAYGGYASPTYGPVPLAPPNPYASPAEAADPYPFSVSDAAQLLSSHGWQVTPGGPDTCLDPTLCGPGTTAGETLSLTLLYPSDVPALGQQARMLQAAAAQAGIDLTLDPRPYRAVKDALGRCPASCGWELGEQGGVSYPALPTGEGLFVPGAALDAGGYSDPTALADVEATLQSDAPSAFYTYEDYLAEQLPLIWVPTPDYQLTEVAAGLEGVTPQNVYLYLDPEDWHYRP